MLFADVTGFTALSERLDPEDVSSVLNDCFSGLVSVVASASRCPVVLLCCLARLSCIVTLIGVIFFSSFFFF